MELTSDCALCFDLESLAGGGSRWVMLIAATVGLCLVVAGVAVAVFSSPGGQAGRVAGASNSPAVATPQAAQPTATQVTTPLVDYGAR